MWEVEAGYPAKTFVSDDGYGLTGKIREDDTFGQAYLAHLLCAEIREGACLAHFEPFITPGDRLQAFAIYLGADPAMTDYAFRAHGHFYYGQGKNGRYSGEAFEIDRGQLVLDETSFDPVIESAAKSEP